MAKSDAGVKAVVVAAIRRHSMEMDAWTNTRLWDDGEDRQKTLMTGGLSLEEGEEPILYSLVSHLNWTLFTSRAIEYAHEGRRGRIGILSIEDARPGNFKGYQNKVTELFEIMTSDGTIHRCPYETGKQSMGTIYALQTLRRVGPAA